MPLFFTRSVKAEQSTNSSVSRPSIARSLARFALGGMSDKGSVGSGSMGSRSAGSRTPSPSNRSRGGGGATGGKFTSPLNNNKSGKVPGAVNKVVPLNNLDAENLRRLEQQIELLGDPDFHLDYPCKDRSRGVNNFSSWSYFQRPQFHKPPINMKNSFLWSDALVERVNKQREYQQFVEEPVVKGYRETQQNLARKKRAKKMLAIWKKTPVRSQAAATDGGAITARTDIADMVTVAPPPTGRGRASSSRRPLDPPVRAGDRSLSRGRK